MERPPIFSQSTTLSWFAVSDGAGAWSFLGILFAIGAGACRLLGIPRETDHPLVVCCVRRRWRVERLSNCVRNRRPSRGFPSLTALARGDAWSVPRILFAIDDPLVVCGARRRWRLERPRNSVRDRRWRVETTGNSARKRSSSRGLLRPTALARSVELELCSRPTTLRGFRSLTALARRASLEFCLRSTTLSWFLAADCAGAWSVLGILFAIGAGAGSVLRFPRESDDPLVVSCV